MSIFFSFSLIFFLFSSTSPYLVCGSDFVKTKVTSEKYFNQDVSLALLKQNQTQTNKKKTPQNICIIPVYFFLKMSLLKVPFGF